MDWRATLERMAEHGTAPSDGCSLFGVGYEDALNRLRSTYIEDRFARGGCAEKFVVGPYGSGKTHFLRHLMEIGRDMDCVTSEIALNKEFDLRKTLITYREVARELRVGDNRSRGIKAVLRACIERVQAKAAGAAAEFSEAWVGGLDEIGLKHHSFARVAQRTFRSLLRGDEDDAELACRWLGGDVSERSLAKELGVSVVTTAEHDNHARRVLLSLFQLIRYAGFRGTVVAYDEAEQGFAMDQRRRDRVLSLLQSNINAIADLEDGSALIVYAVTPDVIEKMEEFAALQQRVSDPAPDLGFFDGNTLAPKIDLSRREDPEEELTKIAAKLLEVSWESCGGGASADFDSVKRKTRELAAEVSATDPGASSRRSLVKLVSLFLLHVYDGRTIESFRPQRDLQDGEDEV